MCIEFIYRHIGKLPKRQLFTSREMLIYGTRSAVDAALCRMVKSGTIKRMARGVFTQDDSVKPSLMEIVQAKARAFHMLVIEYTESVLSDEPASSSFASYGDESERCNDGAITASSNAARIQEKSFAKTGHSCSFWTVQGRAVIKGMSAHKVHLIKTEVGKVVQALWVRGRRLCSNSDVNQSTRKFGRLERKEFWLHGMSMPHWLNEMCRHRYPPVQVN